MLEYLKICIEIVASIKNDSILLGLSQLLEATHIKWVEDKLRTETISLLQQKLEAQEARNNY